MPDNPLGLFGFLPGQMHTNSRGGILGGAVRPFAPGEYLDNPNGSWSNEMAYTLMDPTLNGGKPTNVPGLWVKDGKPYHATEDEAARFALLSKLLFPAYENQQQATQAAQAREADWQKIPKQNAMSMDPLYSLPLIPLPRRK